MWHSIVVRLMFASCPGVCAVRPYCSSAQLARCAARAGLTRAGAARTGLARAGAAFAGTVRAGAARGVAAGAGAARGVAAYVRCHSSRRNSRRRNSRRAAASAAAHAEVAPLIALPQWATRARRARRVCTSRVALAAAVEQGRSRTLVVFSCSLSSVVVLVSRLLCGRRFERSEGAASTERQATRAQRARNARGARVHHEWPSQPQSSRAVRALCWSTPHPLFFVPVAPRAPLPRSTRAGGRHAHHERARSARSARRGARGAWESERHALSELAVRVRGFAANSRPRLYSSRALAIPMINK